MLEKRVHDRAFVHLIGKWLKAGVLEDLNTVIHPATGTQQGGVISPILANIYLHYALDVWFENKVKQTCKGEAMLLRYADDFVCAFQYHRDAKHFFRNLLPERMSRFGLELAPDKTRLVRFSSYGGDKNERFEFLGFEFRQGLNRHQGLRPLMATLIRKLRGHYNYYGVTHNGVSLWEYWDHVNRVVYKWLNRRSQRRALPSGNSTLCLSGIKCRVLA